ncbi:DUF5696 domain-containing protein [Paenibacillus eucommiae]|uniref:Uncharacterized protein n=1 Tax=Paenibacillus eucommiae TaxID=1355755 RepID=A0ABS4IPG2_9BACL|nr:DUF5696 domain-containing protein [Paenibacillus eucommiae]MBP1989445.1 hypothetical protein [Paenibacillus eucommiae]
MPDLDVSNSPETSSKSPQKKLAPLASEGLWLKLWHKTPWMRRVILIAALAIVLMTIIMLTNRDKLPKLQEMGIVQRVQTFIPVAKGEAWQPGPLDADGFATVYDNEGFTLLLAPDTTQIAVRNKQSGFLWHSNPAKSQLDKETVKGLILSNLESPYVMEYVNAGKTQRNMTNALDDKLEKSFIRTEHGVEVTYRYTSIGLSLAIRYELTAGGLEVTVPSQGIEESGDNQLFSLQLLPFFGAVSGKEEDGYLFVPDGPGGLIYYDRTRTAAGNRYDYMMYDEDPANLQERDIPREAIAYPVFGIKRGEEAYAAIVKEGKYTTRITAMPAGVQTTYHSLGAKFMYREEYLRKVSMLAPAVNSVRKERTHQDRKIEYRLLTGSSADYSGMAQAYRDYLLETQQLPELLPQVKHIPMMLGLVGGGTKDVFGGNSYIPATTFAQAEQMVAELSELGVANMKVQVQGWQDGGFSETDRRFPIQAKLGGAEGVKRFTTAMKERGIPVLFEDFLTWMRIGETKLSMKTEGIRSIDTTVFHDLRGTSFLLNPVTAVRSAKVTIDKLDDLGIDGLVFNGVGSTVFSDYAVNGLEREDTAHLYQSLLAYTKERLGTVATDRGNDYVLQSSDLLSRFPLEASYDFFIDETVPFYPMAVHGSLLYTGVEGNLRNEYDKELLKALEYGAIPSFRLTYERSRELKGTDYDNLYSSEYAIWKDRIVEEYKKFDGLASLVNRRMVKHSKQAEGIYTMTYDEGTQVTVDYNSNRFDIRKGGGTP